MVESIVVDRKVSVGVHTNKHLAISTQKIWRVSVDEIAHVLWDRLFKAHLIHFKVTCGEISDFINHGGISSFLQVYRAWVAKEVRSI
jgi:hypothetical protein